nr:hypothetical protein [Escherichia coli]
MSIRIEIGERYVVTSDSFQFILHEKKRAESGKNAGQEWLAVVVHRKPPARLGVPESFQL